MTVDAMTDSINLPVLYTPYLKISWSVSKNHMVLKDPYDVRPAADMIAETAKNRWLEQGLGTHFILGMGEYHDRPSHKITQIYVLNRLMVNCHYLTAAFEYPANLLSESLKNDRPDYNITPEEYYALIDLDYEMGGECNLLTALQKSAGAHAPAATSLLHLHCADKGLRTRFVDAARRHENDVTHPYLRPDDPWVRDFLERAFHESPDEFKDIHVTSPLGVLIRNYSMMVRSDSDRGITMLQSGVSHIMGDIQGEYDRDHSLLGLCQSNQISFLPVFLDWDGKASVQKEDDFIIIEGLSSAGFTPTNEDDFISTTIAEIQEIEKLDQASGNECGYTLEGVIETIQSATNQMTASDKGVDLLRLLRQKPSFCLDL